MTAHEPWLSLPDEDPPERGLAELMAAARVRAEEMAAARTPWWKRAGALLMRPPVLALASVLVLLGGLFVVTSSHKGVSPEPTPIEAPAAPDAVAPAAAAPAPAPAAAAPAPTAAMGSATDAIPAVQPVPALGVSEAHGSTAGFAAPKAYAPKSHAPARVVSKPVPAHHEADKAASFEEPPPPPPPAPAAAPAPVTTSAGGGGVAGNAADDGDASGVVQTRGPVLKKGKSAANPLDDELAKCRAAAARGDCAAVQALANQIRARDAAYYANHVAPDAALAGCLSAAAK